MLETPTNKTLNESLNSWPVGTVGHENETRLICLLNDLCKKHGYGRIPQLAREIEDIWNHPEKAAEYKAANDARLKLLDDYKKELENEDNSKG